mmetsp:Transcript_595/g.919  ORF Transcript_595/g.919 Transcript_595/m.919 type:complete len:516 (-) Transcript_595:50-1597(-)
MLLRDLLKNLETPTPKDLDPEDDAFGNQGAKLVDAGDDLYKGIEDMTQRSKLRSRVQHKIGSSYAGKVVSRSSLMNDDEDDGEAEESDEDDAEFDKLALKSRSKGVSFAEEPDEVHEYEEEEEEEEDRDDDEDIQDQDQNVISQDRIAANLESELKRVQRDEKAFILEQTKGRYKKARAVKIQHRIWENSLKTRIRLQAPLKIAHRLPYHDLYTEFRKTSAKVGQAFDDAADRTLGVLRSLIGLQNKLLEKSNVFTARNEALPSSLSTSSVTSRKRKAAMIFKEASSLWEYTSCCRNFEAHTDNAVRTLERWSTKTKLASGQGQQRKFKAFDRSISDQVEDLLRDMPNLVKRTQLRRIEGCRPLGSKKARNNEELQEETMDGKAMVYDKEVFDDTDFYQEIIRDILDSNEGSAALTLRQRAAKKVKKKKDRRASKGRKVRYVNIPKLTNFTTPRGGLEEDYPRDSLFNSLFGQQIIPMTTQVSSSVLHGEEQLEVSNPTNIADATNEIDIDIPIL